MRSAQVVSKPIGERMRVAPPRGWSMRHAAALAGISHVQWGRLERGERSADNRFMLAAVAKALNVEPLIQRLDLVMVLRLKCDYTGAARLLPDLVRDLHAAVSGPERDRALQALVLAEDTASFVIRYLGDPASAVMIADRGRQAAAQLADPVMLGLAAWSQAHAASGCGLYSRALRIAERAASALEPHTGRPNAKEMLGQLYLTAGFAKYALGDTAAAEAAIAEAEKIAHFTGESPALKLNVGPTAVDFWRVSMQADSGDPAAAVRIARDVDPNGLAVVSRSRQVAFYIDTARALSHIGKDVEALRMLLNAERMAPQRGRLSPMVAETIRALLEKARRGSGWTELRALCERVGVKP